MLVDVGIVVVVVLSVHTIRVNKPIFRWREHDYATTRNTNSTHSKKDLVIFVQVDSRLSFSQVLPSRFLHISSLRLESP